MTHPCGSSACHCIIYSSLHFLFLITRYEFGGEKKHFITVMCQVVPSFLILWFLLQGKRQATSTFNLDHVTRTNHPVFSHELCQLNEVMNELYGDVKQVITNNYMANEDQINHQLLSSHAYSAIRSHFWKIAYTSPKKHGRGCAKGKKCEFDHTNLRYRSIIRQLLARQSQVCELLYKPTNEPCPSVLS